MRWISSRSGCRCTNAGNATCTFPASALVPQRNIEQWNATMHDVDLGHFPSIIRETMCKYLNLTFRSEPTESTIAQSSIHRAPSNQQQLDTLSQQQDCFEPTLKTRLFHHGITIRIPHILPPLCGSPCAETSCCLPIISTHFHLVCLPCEQRW